MKSEGTGSSIFIEAHKADILKYYPLFSEWSADTAFRRGYVYICLKDFEPIGCAVFLPLDVMDETESSIEEEAFLYVRQNLFPEKTLYIEIDYVIREYRDLGIDSKLFASLVRDTGGNFLFAASITEKRNRKNIKIFKT